MKKYLPALLLPLLSHCLHGQLKIAAGSELASTANSLITISTAGNVSNASDASFGIARLILTLNGTGQSIDGNWSPVSLVMNGGADKYLNGSIDVSESLVFTEGTLEVTQTGSFRYTGAAVDVSANSSSYVIGEMKQRGAGERFYPIGTTTQYAPLRFLNVGTDAEDVAVEAFDGTPSLASPDPSIRILSGFWQMSGADPASINSTVEVPLLETLSDEEDAVILQDVNGFATNLGRVPGSDLIVQSALPVTSNLVAVGATSEIDITIKELITPYGSENVYDQLEIFNLEGFAYNKVMLLDRYGVLLKEWENYTNTSQSDYFKTLSPGNYIVIVEYGAEKGNVRKKSQMVTVLRSK